MLPFNVNLAFRPYSTKMSGGERRNHDLQCMLIPDVCLKLPKMKYMCETNRSYLHVGAPIFPYMHMHDICSLNDGILQRTNKTDGTSDLCHQCQRNDKERVIRCLGCKKYRRRYCVSCITRWFVPSYIDRKSVV